jgi:hypothetical protein
MNFFMPKRSVHEFHARLWTSAVTFDFVCAAYTIECPVKFLCEFLSYVINF